MGYTDEELELLHRAWQDAVLAYTTSDEPLPHLAQRVREARERYVRASQDSGRGEPS